MTSAPSLTPARVAALFHALSDETRLQILACLAANERCVCDLTGALDAAQSRLSFHLKVLKDAGLISDRRQGRWIYYSIVPDALEEAQTFLADIREGSARFQLSGCCS